LVIVAITIKLAELTVVKNVRFAVGISLLSVIFTVMCMCIASFDGHVAISGCQSQSPGDTVFKLAINDDNRFGVVIQSGVVISMT